MYKDHKDLVNSLVSNPERVEIEIDDEGAGCIYGDPDCPSCSSTGIRYVIEFVITKIIEKPPELCEGHCPDDEVIYTLATERK